MDCYSAESEFIESLDFLSPPVKRINSREAFGSVYNTDANNVHLLRGFRNKFSRRAPSSTRNNRIINKTNTESSTSLVLKKTSERQILEHYSIVSYASLHRLENDASSTPDSNKNQNITEKPLIKVTVIPKTDHVQTAKLLRKRRYMPKRIQSTTSNHENSVQTKNVYLIVAGRRREKIYEIKTTGSAKFSTDHDSYAKDEEIPIKELSNFKHLIQSLNMNRKKRKEKKVPVENSDALQQTSLEWKDFPETPDCTFKIDSNNSPKKGRVKIFGQFGISEDDKYILRYGATVNNKQVLSDVAQLTRDFSPILATASYGANEGPSAVQKDSSIQADYNNDFNIEKSLATNQVPSKESQGTQVNFNVQLAMTKPKCATFSDKKTQCSCCAVINKSDHNTLKECQSPLVIISVYPKPSPEDLLKSSHIPTADMRTPSPQRTVLSKHQVMKAESPKKSFIETRRSYKSPPLSRSASPVKKTSRPKVSDNTIKAQMIEKISPDRQKALRAIKEKIQEKDQIKKNTSARKVPSPSHATTYASQVSKNLQDLTVSNATQVSRKNQRVYTASNATQVSNKNNRLYTASNGTQVSARRLQNYTVSNATQYSSDAQSIAGSRSLHCYDSNDSVHSDEIAPIKHAKIKYPSTKTSPIKPPRTALVSNATQVPKLPHFFASNATQVSGSDGFTASNATQVSKSNQIAMPPGSKNQETYTSKPTHIFKNEQPSKLVTKKNIESGTNTNHDQTKKLLVASCTKKLTQQMNKREFIPAKFDNSKVTINIDADKEYYDVRFNQDKLSTDLTIRKTLKDMGSQKCNEEECSASLENLLYLPECAMIEKGLFKPGTTQPAKTMSIALHNNLRTNDGSPVNRHVSGLTIRDSLEISHRREDKTNTVPNIKNTQTCFTNQFEDNVPDETEFLAPIKHFTGDDCSICDPIERDKQIRELLGVDKVKQNYAVSQQVRHCENDVGIPHQCIYRQKCKKSQVTEINFEFQKLCPCYNTNRQRNKKTKHVQAQNIDYSKGQSQKKNDPLLDTKKYVRPHKSPKEKKGFSASTAVPSDLNNCDNKGDNLGKDECKSLNKEPPAIYQQLILNRNIQVFLQVDQFSKQRPIILSRKQYDKVKKTIQKTICVKKSSHNKRKSLLARKHDCSGISIGTVRAKQPKDCISHQEKEAQTDAIECSPQNCKKHKVPSKYKNRKHKKHDIKEDSTDQSEDVISDHGLQRAKKTKKGRNKKGAIKTITSAERDEVGHVDLDDIEQYYKEAEERHKNACEECRSDEPTCSSNKTYQEDLPERDTEQYGVNQDRSTEQISPDLGSEETRNSPCVCNDPEKEIQEISYGCSLHDERDDVEINRNEVRTFVLFNAENTRNNVKYAKDTQCDAHTRKTMSSMEVRYAGVAYMKQVAYSSTDVGVLSDSSIAHVNSFHTIFRGHRKSATPNLGTSAYSLYSEEGYNSENKSAKFIMEPRDSKPKKPFLRRLMSCLVMRSTRDSELKLPTGPAADLPSVNSSIDSYHISTSLGAVEVSSSIYDTSASFYSNHTILPVNSKIKRGFFSSVRGFLTNRKS